MGKNFENLFIKIFRKNSKRDTPFFQKSKNRLKKGLKKRWSLQKSQKSLKKMGNVKKNEDGVYVTKGNIEKQNLKNTERGP